ncbi:hypothetical protein [Jiella mangrovi]|uniref:Uncharacterized protein n=1 Tax=Jiella mangrovi TaxID=2821407 RepID=A0ABS4BN66_9HYPH|nr:hypothetical protein [Jiella mangrovi]MBP0618091.1 hypothetical protein [Jiella mangrovi]
MKKFMIFASALTISAAGLGASGAWADCASDLKAMRSEMGQQSSTQTASTMSGEQSGSTTSSPSNGNETAQNATGELSGVAPTSALGEVAGGNQTSADKKAEEVDQNAMSGSSQSDTASTDDSQMSTASTSPNAGGGEEKSQMRTAHLEAAQSALDAGDEQACMAALEAARSAN